MHAHGLIEKLVKISKRVSVCKRETKIKINAKQIAVNKSVRMRLKKVFSYLLLTLALVIQTSVGFSADEQTSSGFVDDSLRDITVVIGSGAVGAVLGLSTLSFVDKPGDHLKNVAIGGAVGIVIGVGIVIFSQATRTSMVQNNEVPMNADKFATLARHDFGDVKIAQDHLKVPSFGYSFDF
jgi:hypothetical protein